MWDWISVSTDNEETWAKVIDSPLLDFQLILRHGELLISKAEYQGIKFELRERRRETWIRFSPHKLYNLLHNELNRAGQPMNQDTFTPSKLKCVFRLLEQHFAVKPNLCHVHHIEFGVNLYDLNVSTSTILDSLMVYGWKPFNIMETKGSGNGRQIVAAQYRLKIYDKGLQNLLPYEILRFEFKARKMQSVEKIFPNHPRLSDLLEPSLWWKCKDKLLAIAGQCIFKDEFGADLTDKHIVKLANWENPLKWKHMPTHSRCRNKKTFEELIQLYGKHKIKQAIKDGIEREVSKMLAGNDGVS